MFMHRTIHNFKYLLALCLSISLILSLTSGIHMHVQHADHASIFSDHTIDVHSTSDQHDSIHELAHADSIDESHHSAAIDIKPESLIKKQDSLNPFILFIFLSCLLLPIRQLFNRWASYQQPLPYFTRQLSPPLRAPPSL